MVAMAPRGLHTTTELEGFFMGMLLVAWVHTTGTAAPVGGAVHPLRGQWEEAAGTDHTCHSLATWSQQGLEEVLFFPGACSVSWTNTGMKTHPV